MAFPWDEIDDDEEILLDTNPVFGRLVWPLFELLVITGIVWLLIGFIDNPGVASNDFMAIRNFLLLAWIVLVFFRVARPLLAWLGERFVLTDRRIILRRGLVRPRVVTIDLRSIRGIDRNGTVLLLRTNPFGPPMALRDVPSTRKVAKMVARMT